MKKPIIFSLIAIFGIFCFIAYKKNQSPAYIKLTKTEKGDRAEEFSKALEDEYNLLKDPHTGKVPEGIRELELMQAQDILREQSSGNTAARMDATMYTFQGPNNLGGRTRAICYDISDASSNTLIAGSVSGGVFKTTNGGTSWTRVNPSNQIYSITAIAQDTRPGFTNTWYYGGGEGSGNSASEGTAVYRGDGIYKSTDGGNTWAKLPASNTGSLFAFDNRMDYIYNIAINPVNGDVYVACAGGIKRSQDGGTTWTDVLGIGSFSSSHWTEIVISSTGRIYAAFAGNTSNTIDGVWTSTTGDAGSYTRISGTGVAGNPAGWNAFGAYGRTVMALAPSSENLLFVMYYNNIVSACPASSPEVELYRWNQTTLGWTDLSATLPDEAGCSVGNDPIAVQGGYDMAIAIKPDNPNTIIIGGTNAYRSTNSGNTWTRIGGYNSSASYAQYLNHHSDIHTFRFKPNDPARLVCGNDGGIQTADITAATVAWTPLNNSYQTYQYYHVAIKQDAGVNDFIGGAQDNGTSTGFGGSTNFTSILSGDGVAVGLGAGSSPYKQYCGSQSGAIYRRNSALAPNTIEANLTPGGTASIFVTYFLLDPDNTENLYYACQESGFNSLLRINNASTATAANWQLFDFVFTGYIRALATTRGTYSAASRLYAGTDAGRVYRFTDPVNTALTTVPVEITPTGMAGLGTVIGIATNPNDHDEIMVVYSNYSTASIWHTTNAGSATPSWTNIEGNLSLPSIRSCMIVRSGGGQEYYVGTSIGLYKTNLLNGASTVWTQEAVSEIGNSVVTSLSLRPSDNTFAIGTHGSGMWRGVIAATLPVEINEFSGELVDDGTNLKWITSEESNNKGFDIERSYDGLRFERIGFVAAQHNSSATNTYTFRDNELAQDENFYRLRQIDLDGTSTYSSIILIKNKLAKGPGMKILRNPFNNYIDFQLGRRETDELSIKLIDLTGRIVRQERVKSGLNRIRFNLTGTQLNKGVYVLVVTDGTKQHTAKLVRE